MSKINAPRKNRVPIMLSDAELAAIDDWRFAHRIPTRSRAIRELASMGASDLETIALLQLSEAALNCIIDYHNIDPAETIYVRRGLNGRHEATLGEAHQRISEFMSKHRESGQ